jgi:hypothetical protein
MHFFARKKKIHLKKPDLYAPRNVTKALEARPYFAYARRDINHFLVVRLEKIEVAKFAKKTKDNPPFIVILLYWLINTYFMLGSVVRFTRFRKEPVDGATSA